MKLLRILSYGGGVQSNALMVLQAQGLIQYDAFVFANVGANAENPATLAYLENYAKPYMQQAGIPFFEVKKVNRAGEVVDLYDYTLTAKRDIPLPVRMPSGAFGNRKCTTAWKIEQIDKWAKKRGASHWVVGLGISLDEVGRARGLNWEPVNKDSERWLKRPTYPLLDLRLRRRDCQKLIQQTGLPLPPKSSCSFCPFKRRSDWQELSRSQPDEFEKAAHLEQVVSQRFQELGRGNGISFHPDGVPLAQAVGNQPPLFSDEMLDACESGYCMV